MLTDGSIVNFIAEVKAKDRNLGRKILYAIKSLLKKWGLVIDNYKGRELDTAEAQALSQFENTFKKLQEMYRDAFMDANEVVAKLSNSVNSGAEKSQNNTTVEGDIKFANRQHYWASGFSHNEMSYVERIARHEVELTDN